MQILTTNFINLFKINFDVILAASPEARPFRLYRIPLHALSGLVAPCERRCPTPTPEPPEPPSGARLLAEPPRGISRSCSSSPTPQSFLPPPK